MKYTLISSNISKINEFKNILGDLISIASGKDIKEVDGTMDEVILYKALEAGRGRIVEDTILEVDGIEVVDIRYSIKQFSKKSTKAKWIVSLGVNDGDSVFVYRGVIDGYLKAINNIPDDSFGFDAYFYPSGSDLSLYALDKLGQKQNYSARKIALENLLLKNSLFAEKLGNLPKWHGSYQN